jgi:pimeloyl-ACP methyl ester carboxylesterase
MLVLASVARGEGVISEEPTLPPLPGHTIVTLGTRPGVTMRVLFIQPLRPKASAVLFTGGTGAVGIRPTGVERSEGLLIAGREQLALSGFLVAIPDLPSDRDGPTGLTGFRTSREHAQDAAAVIGLLRRRARVPVWLLGGSRGSVSAANAAARLPRGVGPNGLILLSGLLVPAGPADTDVLFTLPLSRIHGPVLIVHHREDACDATPFAAVRRLEAALPLARPREVKTFSGGGPVSGPPCASGHHHGFVGLGPQVLQDVAGWISMRSASMKR